MNQVDIKPINDTRTIAKRILDFLIGFLGSFIVGNLAIIFVGEYVMPDRMETTFFVIWFWRCVAAGLAVFFFTRKRTWISIGLVTAILTQASNLYIGLAGLAIMVFIMKKLSPSKLL
jgi:hypothetical protein